MSRPDLSVVVPLYNERQNVAPLCRAIREALSALGRDYEVLLVDDGSSDGTREVLADEAAADARIRLLLIGRNSGQTAAMAAGFSKAEGRVIVTLDGDLQNDPRDIPKLLDRLDQGLDVVCGWRRERQDTWLLRTLPSRVANLIIRRVTGVPVHDTGCTLKAYRGAVIRSLILYSDMHRFLPALTSMTGARIGEVPVRHHPRRHGRSKYGVMRTFKVVADLIGIKLVMTFGTRPGTWFGLLALPPLALGLTTGILTLLDGSLLGGGDVVLTSLTVIFIYLACHLLTLAILAKVYLASADRSYLRQLNLILTRVDVPRTGADEQR